MRVDLPSRHRPVDDELLKLACRIVDASPETGRLERDLSAAVGRRRRLSLRALLAGLVYLALDDRPLHLKGVTELLYVRLGERGRRALRIEGRALTKKHLLARYRCVRYLFHRFLSLIDPSPLKKNRRLFEKEAAEAAGKMSEEEMESRRMRLEVFVNDLVESSLSLMTEKERLAFTGSLGLDATPVKLYSRGPSRRAGLSASDPDGGWYVREGDHRGEEDHRGRVRGKVFWALEATLAVMAPEPDDPGRFPNLALGVVLGRPGSEPGETATRVLASISARGHRAGFLGVDRNYSSARAEDFHLPARALGYEPVFDYRSDELGPQANSQGALLVEGRWYCCGMPKALVNATVDHRAGLIDKECFEGRIAARRHYGLYAKSGPDEDGFVRVSCPASGGRPKMICPLRPASAGDRPGRMKVLFPPAEPPRLCLQEAITIPPDVAAKHRQQLAYMSESWRARYATCRNTIEGENGYLKDPAHEALDEPARRRVRGIAAQSVFVGLLVLAANVRKLRAHRDLLAEKARVKPTERAPRRRTVVTTHLPRA